MRRKSKYPFDSRQLLNMLPSLEYLYERKFLLLQHLPGMNVQAIDSMVTYQIRWMYSRLIKMTRDHNQSSNQAVPQNNVVYRRKF